MANKAKEIQHGTYAGYSQHIRRKQEPCDDCKKARKEYQVKWRINKKKLEKHRENRNTARDRALEKLKNLHFREYRRLYMEELNNEQKVQQ